MAGDSHAAPAWLTAIAAAVLVAGTVVAALGFRSASEASGARSDARAEADAQQALVADEEAVLADLRLEVERERAALEAAETALEQAETDRAAVEVQVSTSRQLHRQAEQDIPTRQAEARAFVDAIAPLVDLASTHLEAAQGIHDIRARQVEEALGGDFRGFNQMQSTFNEVADAANTKLDEINAMMAGLPAMSQAARLVGTDSGRFVTSDSVLDPPTGRARISMTSSDVIPCTPWGSDGCLYSWVVTFTETNWLDVTIERIAVRYDERGGRAYWYSENGEWRDVHIVVPAGGSATYDSWLRTDDEAKTRLILGGKLKVRFRGTDADGNAITGALTVALERP